MTPGKAAKTAFISANPAIAVGALSSYCAVSCAQPFAATV